MYQFDWLLPFRAPYAGWILQGLGYTCALFVISSVLAIAFGAGLGIACTAGGPWARKLARGYVEIFRNVPTLFWLLFFFYVLPNLAPERWVARLNHWDGLPFWAAICALTLSNAAHFGEIIRSGFSALPIAQHRVASSLGLSRTRVWCQVLLPQAFRISLPAIGPRMIHNLHLTALAMFASVPELTWQTQQIESITFRGFEAVTVATVIFILLSIALGGAFRLVELRLRRWS